jgi:hypothetical protein
MAHVDADDLLLLYGLRVLVLCLSRRGPKSIIGFYVLAILGARTKAGSAP